MDVDENQGAFLTEAQLASLWGVTRARAAQCRSSGKGPPFVKLPTGEIRYSSADVEQWLASERRTRTSKRKSSAPVTTTPSAELGARLISLGQELVSLGMRSAR